MTERKEINDCAGCLARLDGADATYCYHTAFEKTHPGDGRIIPNHPLETPAWCPGMVSE